MSDKRKATVLLTLLLISALSLAVHASHEDIHQKIWQEARYHRQHNQQQNEADLTMPETISPQKGVSWLVIHGQKLKIRNNINDIGQALYLAINDQQWQEVSYFLAIYQKMPAHDPLLVYLAKGALARIQGNVALAIAYYQKILHQQPNFTRAKLELARLYFEDQNNRASEKLFKEISQQHQLPKMVLKNIDRYLQAINQRDGWHGSFSFGYAYDDNINMSPNQKASCLVFKSGKCVLERHIPKPIKEGGETYNATLSWHYQLVGHHGIFGRSLIYGEHYPHYHDENENTFLLIGGYNYKSRTQDFSFGPEFEYKHHAGNTEYHAIGAKIEWYWNITDQTTLNVELGHKKLTFQPLYHWKDGSLFSSNFRLSHTIGDGAVLFGGGNWDYRHAQQPTVRYQQWGVNAGITGQLYSGINGSLFITLRKQQMGRYDPLLNARRQDNELISTASVTFPGTKIGGMTPSITFKHRHNRSNVNWLYSYDKNEVQIQLEKYF